MGKSETHTPRPDTLCTVVLDNDLTAMINRSILCQ